MGKKNCFVSLFEEKDFLEASKFIIEEKEHCHDGYLFFPEQYEGKNFPEYYRAINMRTNHFHEAEVYAMRLKRNYLHTQMRCVNEMRE